MSSDIFKYIASQIPNAHYYSHSVFDEEKTRIFENSWHYVGLRTDFVLNNDFITLDIGAISVVVQKLNGKVKAFHNVCTHRYKKIQVEKKGNRYLTCQYHGWTYNDNGIPYGIPMKSEFEDLNAETLQLLCLKEFNVDYCGEFVFVNVSSDNNKSLKDYLRDTFSVIEEISTAVGKQYLNTSYEFKANWKIVIENTLEGYHLSSVHPDTFGKIGMTTKSDTDFILQGLHSSMIIHPYGEASIKQMKKFETLIKNRPFKPAGFFHQFVFPNMLIGSAYGFTFYIGYIKPISATLSEFVFHFYETKLNEGAVISEEISKALSMTTGEFNNTVMEEDIEMVNNVQLGISQGKAIKGVLSSKEKRIHHFQKSYMNVYSNGLNELK